MRPGRGLMLIDAKLLRQLLQLPEDCRILDFDRHWMGGGREPAVKVVVESETLPEVREGDQIPTVTPQYHVVGDKTAFKSCY